MKPKTRKLVILGQSIEARYQLGFDAPETTSKWESAEANDDKNNYGGKGKFELPSDHKAAMVLTSGTFSCANCKFVNAEKHECNNSHYIEWNGGSKKLPDAPLDKICSDWFEPKK